MNLRFAQNKRLQSINYDLHHWEDKLCCSYQKHAESFPHDAVEEVEGGVSCHHEEVGEEEVLPAAIVQQSIMLAAKQRLIGILEEKYN